MFASSYCSTTVRPLGLFSLPDFAMQKSWGYPPPPPPPLPSPLTPFLWLRWSLDKSLMFSASNGCFPSRREFQNSSTRMFCTLADVSQPTPRKINLVPLFISYSWLCSRPHVAFPSVSCLQWKCRSRRVWHGAFSQLFVFLWVEHDLHCHSISLWVSSVALAIVGRGWDRKSVV